MKFGRGSSKKSWTVLILLVLALPVSDCAKNPVTGKRQLVLISEQQEIAIGRESHPEILAEFGEVENPALQASVSELGRKLAADSQRPDLPWTFTVVDSPVVNAFALPGGYIYVTRQILVEMNNEAELAGVLGHEIGHVTARHSVGQISRAQLIGLGLGLGTVFSDTFRNFGQLAELGAGVLFLKYSRDAERQADQLGIDYMFQQGYDPRQMSSFFQVFESLREQSGAALPSWLSSHPDPPDRRRTTLQQAEQLIASAPGRRLLVNEERHLSLVEGLVYGENPREGFVEEGWFLHPDLRFRFGVPRGWRVQNTRSSVILSEPGESAAIQLTLVPRGVTAEERARELASRPGVRVQWGGEDRLHGNPALLGLYEVPTQQGSLAALAAWIEYEGRLYQLIGITPASAYSRFFPLLEDSIRSFQRLTDRRALGVQPDRIRLHRCRRGETLEQLARQAANPRVDLQELARLNRLEPEQALPQGKLVKLVASGR